MKIWFQGSSWRADAHPALVRQLLMCREATKYGSTLVCECKAAAPETGRHVQPVLCGTMNLIFI